MYYGFRPKMSIMGLLLMVSVVSINGVSWQTERNATYQPYRFTTQDGDSLYLVRATHISSWSDRYLIVKDSYDHVVYFLDTTSMIARRVGREGDGPGEYRATNDFSLRSDTLVVAHGGGYQASLYHLPSLEFIKRLRPKSHFPTSQLWEPEGTFLSNDLPWRRRGFLSADRPGDQIEDGLFGRFTEDGELIEVFGIDEFDPMKKYGSERELVRSINSGSLVRLPSGNVVFVYNRRPLLLEYTPSGRLVAEMELEMPWNNPRNPNPFWSTQFNKWQTRGFIYSCEVTSSGFLIAARGWQGGESIMQMVVALYDWEGNLLETISLPKRLFLGTTEGFLYGVTELNGEYWVTIKTDPNIMKLIIR